MSTFTFGHLRSSDTEAPAGQKLVVGAADQPFEATWLQLRPCGLYPAPPGSILYPVYSLDETIQPQAWSIPIANIGSPRQIFVDPSQDDAYAYAAEQIGELLKAMAKFTPADGIELKKRETGKSQKQIFDLRLTVLRMLLKSL